MVVTQRAETDVLPLRESHVVVCLDDDGATLAAVHRTLRNEPYELLTTERPGQLLEWLDSRKVSLVISDQRMPGLCGTELLEEVRKRSPSTAGVILTAYPGATFGTPGLRQSVECMISKPWDEEMLKRAIRQMLRARELAERDERASLER